MLWPFQHPKGIVGSVFKIQRKNVAHRDRSHYFRTTYYFFTPSGNSKFPSLEVDTLSATDHLRRAGMGQTF